MARVKSKKYIGVYLNKLENGDISYSITYKSDQGKKVWFTVGKKSEGITETFSNTKRNEFINKINLGEDPIAHKKKKDVTTLDDLAKTYFDDKEKANRTNVKQGQKYDLHIKPILGSRDIDSISKDDVKGLQKKLDDNGKAPKTINGIIQLLTAIINYSIKEYDRKIINPCTGVKRLQVDDERQRWLSANEVQILLDDVEDNEQLSLFVKLALNTGARLDAIMHIQKKDFSLDHNSVVLKDLKSGKTYTGFYDDNLKKYLKGYLRHLQANSYLMGKQTKPQYPRTIQRHLKGILDDLFNGGLDVRDTKNRVVIHTLRHTFASHLAINGIPIFTIQKLMNHADITHTMRYAKLAPDSGLNAIKGLYK